MFHKFLTATSGILAVLRDYCIRVTNKSNRIVEMITHGAFMMEACLVLPKMGGEGLANECSKIAMLGNAIIFNWVIVIISCIQGKCIFPLRQHYHPSLALC